MPFSFVHAADLHLDSPFQGITAESPAIAEALRSSTFEAYDALIDLCIEHGVQFLLISGDVYDGADRSLRAQLRFRDGLQRLADSNIQAYVVHGNHDPYRGHSRAIDWPSGVHVFHHRTVESVTVEIEGIPIALISGISHESRNVTANLAEKFSPADTDLFHIGMLHCNVGSDTGHEAYAPCELQDLLSRPIDYWALGHVHEKRILHDNPYVVYPGNIQGRHIREQNERGCYLVQVDEATRDVTMEFHELDKVRWFSGNVPIDGLQSLDQLEQSVTARIEDFIAKADSRPLVCRLILNGRGPLFRDTQKAEAREDLLLHLREAFEPNRPFVWVQDLVFDCAGEIDLEERSERSDFLGQVLRLSQEFSTAEEGMQRLLEEGLAELYGNRRARKYLQDVDDEEVRQMLKEAERLCVQMLET